MLSRPEPSEYSEYFGRYVSLVETENIVGLLASQLPATIALIRTLDPDYRYAPGKWTVKQSLGHMIDTERVMAYRALRIARGDKTPLPGFDQDLFVNGADYASQSIDDLIAEFEAVRRATLLQFRHNTAEMWTRTGTASNGPVSARALAYIIAGHEIYHCKLFEEKYRR
jgi:hypothetical protein